MKSNRSKQRERRFGSLFPLFPSVHSFDPQKILSPCINRRDLALAGQLAEGVFKRRDAKNAEKRAFDAAIVELPTDNLHRNCTHFGFNFGRTKRRPRSQSFRALALQSILRPQALPPHAATAPKEGPDADFGFRGFGFRPSAFALRSPSGPINISLFARQFTSLPVKCRRQQGRNQRQTLPNRVGTTGRLADFGIG
jgi:hypothetical protein